MCLKISRLHHKYFCGIPLPKRAKCDIHVFKALDWINIDKYRTPYQKVPVEFKQFKAELFVKHFTFIDGEVAKGIHAFRYKGRDPIFDAIIPKGTLYYIGTNDDIVSKKLIIFRTYSSYLEYLGNKRIPIEF